jgi:integrase/recombinase XerD
LGLRHADISVEDGTLQIVPRDDNPNGARAKTHVARTIPVMADLLQLYTDYLIEELGALEAEALPDFIFVNLFEGEIGRPMTYAAVMSLVRRLTRATGIAFTPHMLRHSRATMWIRDDKLSLETVAPLLGHASIQTTHDIYVHLTQEDLKEALSEARRRRHGSEC